VLDGLLYHQSEVAARRHHTDGGGDSDHVFALCSLLGFQFAPRIPDLKSRRLYSVGKASAYPSLEPLIAGRINVVLIRAHWSEILRVAASIRTGTVTASLILRQLVGPAHAQYLGELEQHATALSQDRDRRDLDAASQRISKPRHVEPSRFVGAFVARPDRSTWPLMAIYNRHVRALHTPKGRK
jgi:Tn3 transposase DDE domain